MTRTTEITPDNREHWLALRAGDITSTESPALFDLSEYFTKFELWHIKAGHIQQDPFAMNERMRWGGLLEGAIAEGVADKYGLEIARQSAYKRLADSRMGASYDFEITGMAPSDTGADIRKLFGDHGPGNLEIKNVDKFIAKQSWADDGLPNRIEIQVQHQMHVSGAPWTLVAGLAGGNELMLRIRMRDEGVGAALERQIVAFWASVAAGDEPEPVYAKDGGTLSALYAQASKGSRYVGDPQELDALCAEYKDAAEVEKSAVARKDEARAQILHILKDHDSAVMNGYKISAGTVAEAEVKAYTRKPYRLVRITEIK
ncbi:MAG: YqaJ viral recombinase family protein [Alphaproteobacteria bacterium]